MARDLFKKTVISTSETITRMRKIFNVPRRFIRCSNLYGPTKRGRVSSGVNASTLLHWVSITLSEQVCHKLTYFQTFSFRAVCVVLRTQFASTNVPTQEGLRTTSVKFSDSYMYSVFDSWFNIISISFKSVYSRVCFKEKIITAYFVRGSGVL